VTFAPDPAADMCGSEHCITCGDDGVPITVLDVDDRRGLALCEDEAGQRSTVEIGLVEPVAPEDRLLVHAAVALATLKSAASEAA